MCTGGVQHGAGGPALESGGQTVTAPRLLLRSVRADGAGLLMCTVILCHLEENN